MSRWLAAALVAASLPQLASAARQGRCAEITRALADALTEIECFESADLTTNGPLTTPPNDSLAGFPPFAFTPQTDRATISPSPPNRTAVAGAVPGIQLEARLADDPQARFLLRLPDAWNGRLVVAGASGTRSEFNGDFAWSDYVVQKGYAYASQNKGILNLRFTTTAAERELACRLSPDLPLLVNFYVNDPGGSFAEWQGRIVEAAAVAREGVRARYGDRPRRTYAVGTSNGGYQVRRAIEEAPHLFDGGVDWEGTFVDPGEHNLLVHLPAAVRHFDAYRDAGFDAASPHAAALRAAGYPPDLVRRDPVTNAVTASFWQNHWNSFWEVTQCQWQKRLDPAFDTYAIDPATGLPGTATYDYLARRETTDVDENLRAFETTGKIKRPLVTIGGTMDALLPTVHHARAYAAKVAASRRGNDAHRHAQHRLYEVQNGNHLETYRDTFPQLELVQPHAHRAFDLLVAHVEEGAPLPPDQCIPRGGAISATPARRGVCAELFVE
jgi:hypothetical protein